MQSQCTCPVAYDWRTLYALYEACKQAEAYASLNSITPPPKETTKSVLESLRTALAQAEMLALSRAIEAWANQCEVCSHSKSDYVHTVAELYARLAKAHAVAERLMELSRNPIPSVMVLRACADTLRSL